MKGKKKCLSCSVICILLFTVLLCFPVYAAEYGEQYPNYVNQSGGCFIECQTNLGKGALILPVNYCKETIGFSGAQYNVMNVTNSTVSGYFVLENGTSYNARASSFSTFQYQSNEDYYSRYYDITVSKIYNTNCYFVDYQGERQNSKYDFSNNEIISVICLVFLILIFFVMITNKQKGSDSR